VHAEAPPTEKVPAAHIVHADEPGFDEKYPLAQFKHFSPFGE
jgi:hypothetical protein